MCTQLLLRQSVIPKTLIRRILLAEGQIAYIQQQQHGTARVDYKGAFMAHPLYESKKH